MSVTLIRPNLWLGSKDPASDAGWLASNQIDVVINVAWETSDPPISGIQFIKVPLIDGAGNAPSAVQAAVRIVGDWYDKQLNTLVHCMAGSSRSPYVVAKVLAQREMRAFPDVYSELYALRPEVAMPGWLFGIYG